MSTSTAIAEPLVSISALRVKGRPLPGRVRLELEGLRGCTQAATHVAAQVGSMAHVEPHAGQRPDRYATR